MRTFKSHKPLLSLLSIILPPRNITIFETRAVLFHTISLARLVSPPAMRKFMIWSTLAGALLLPTCTALPRTAASLTTASCKVSNDVAWYFWTITLPNDYPNYDGSGSCGTSVWKGLQDVCGGGITGWHCAFESDGTTALITFNSDIFCNSDQIDQAVGIATGTSVTIDCPQG